MTLEVTSRNASDIGSKLFVFFVIVFTILFCLYSLVTYLWSQIFRAINVGKTGCFMGPRLIKPAHTVACPSSLSFFEQN